MIKDYIRDKSLCPIGVPRCAFCERLAFARRRDIRTWRRHPRTSWLTSVHGHTQRTSRSAQLPMERGDRHATAPSLVGRLDVLFDTPVGNKPNERNSNIEHDRDPRLNKGKQNRRGVERE
jgi:hypothetical protein